MNNRIQRIKSLLSEEKKKKKNQVQKVLKSQGTFVLGNGTNPLEADPGVCTDE